MSVSSHSKRETYEACLARIDALIEGEQDWIAVMATVACELHHSFDTFDWTGFYRHVGDELLLIGPYQGSHGCLQIPFSRGVCGAAARHKTTQLIANVHDIPHHIACSSSTQSEIVAPILDARGQILAVLDVDSNTLENFDETDKLYLERLCATLGERFGETTQR